MQAGFQQYYQPQIITTQGSGGIPAMGDPNDFAQQYANQKGITLEDAKKELKDKHGDPTKPTSTSISTSATTSSTYSTAGTIATFSTLNMPEPQMPDRKEVHHNDKKWLKDFHRSHPGTSRTDAQKAFYAQHGRMPV